MAQKTTKNKKETFIQIAPGAGFILVAAGILLLVDQKVHTTWLSLSVPIVIGIILVIIGLIEKRRIWLISGHILTAIGLSVFVLFQRIVPLNISRTVFWACMTFAGSWFSMFITLILIFQKPAWWALFVSSISFAVGINFFIGRQYLLTYIFTVSLAIGVTFLLWGTIRRKLGLLIPGLLITTIGSGVFFGWKNTGVREGLTETGIMLVWFSLGWILITVLSRILDKRFVWWPLIPGGILSMVGSGLYIGGNPSNALGFVRNTGSIGLILFGVYLILMKFGIKKE